MSSTFRSRSLLVALVLVLAGAAAQACGEDGNGATSNGTDAGAAIRVPEAGSPVAVSTPTQASAQVGVAGGKVMTTTGTGVEIPANALSGNVGITVAEAASAEAPAGAVGAPVQLGPSGLLFSAPATVVIGFDPAKLPPGKTAADVVIYTAPDGTKSFSALTTSVRDATHVAAQTMHFSVFAPVVPGAVDDAGAPDDAGKTENDAGPDASTTSDAGQTDASTDGGAPSDGGAVTDASTSDGGTATDAASDAGSDAGSDAALP